MRIIVISGSLNGSSYTRELCSEVIRSLKDNFSCDASLWDLRKQALPFHNPRYHHAKLEELPTKLRVFRMAVYNADAVVFASPVYHNSFSGVLKNAIDHLTIEVMQYKPTGLLSHGGNRSPQAVDHLRIIMRGVHSVAIPTQVCTDKGDYSNTKGTIKVTSPDILNRISRFNQELIHYTVLFQAYRKKVLSNG